MQYCHLFRILLEQGANPNHKDLNKNTPMLLAAQAGNVPVVSLLLLFGGQLTKAAYLTKVGRHGKAVTNTGIANSKFTHQIWAYNAEVNIF